MPESKEYNTAKSWELYQRAKEVLPQGVNYGIHYFDPYPFYVKYAYGCKLIDVDENKYDDYWMAHNVLILGHIPPEVVKAVKKQLDMGMLYGVSNELEIQLAEQVVKMVPSAKMVRFTNSGTEANMYATRLARTCTDRKKIAKFEGGWHGGYDSLHKSVKHLYQDSGSYPLESGGILPEVLENTLVLPFNDIEGTRNILKQHKNQIAGIFIEPVLGAGGAIPAEKDFLQELREICSDEGILLIFDEVITGFRLAPGGAQQFYGVYPNITTMGKILGGGYAVGGFAASKEIMEHINSSKYDGKKYSFHGGTHTANPITTTAGLETLKILEDGKVINELNKMGECTREKLREIFERRKVDVQVTGISSLFQTHFTKYPVKNARDVAEKTDKKRLISLHDYLRSRGIFFFPGRRGVLSTAHGDEELERLFEETDSYLKSLL